MDRLSRQLQHHLASSTKRQIPTKALISYIVDYLIIMQVTPMRYRDKIGSNRSLRVLAIIYAALDKLVTPFSQHFSLNNISIQYPYAVHERIPIHVALLISGVFPAAVILVYTLFIDGFFSHHRRTTHTRSKYTITDRLWELNCGWLGLLLAQGAAFVITGSLKNLCGKPRPDLIDRCQPRAGSSDGVPYGLVTKSICTQQDEAIMQDGKSVCLALHPPIRRWFLYLTVPLSFPPPACLHHTCPPVSPPWSFPTAFSPKFGLFYNIFSQFVFS